MRSLIGILVVVLALPGAAGAGLFNLGNLVWHDVNGNGVQEVGEPGVAGVVVQLVTADHKQLIDEATTNGSGSYTVVGQTPGAFRIRVSPPAGWEFARRAQGDSDQKDSDVNPDGPDWQYSEPYVAATNLISTSTVDVGLVQATTTVSVGDFVWNDLDGDGVQDGGEPGVAGVQVELWNATKTTRLAVTTTSLLGLYSFDAPAPSLARIRVIPPAGMEHAPQGLGDASDGSDVAATGPDRGFTDALPVATCCSTAAIDAGLLLPDAPATIGNRVWLDADADGIQDQGEAGVAGVTVELWDAARTRRLDTAVTNGTGSYSVTGNVPGGFRLRVVAPSGHQFAPDDAGIDDLVDSDIDATTTDAGWSAPFFLAGNVISTTSRDAGLVLPVNPVIIGNQLWLDADYDGLREAGEPSVQGLTVELWNASMTELIATDTTDAGGLYALDGLAPGAYRIRVPLAENAGIAFTLKDADVNDLIDSDVNPWGDDLGFSDVLWIASNVLSISKEDAGLLPQEVPEPGSLGGAAALLALGACVVTRRARPTAGHPRQTRAPSPESRARASSVQTGSTRRRPDAR